MSGIGAPTIFESIPIIGPVGSLLALPLTQSVDQLKIAKQWKFNRAQPMVLPDPGMLWDCYLRRIGEAPDQQFKTKWVDMALQYHGINLGQNIPDLTEEEVPDFAEGLVCGYHVWKNAATAMLEVPAAGQILDARRRELIGEGEAKQRLRRARADVDRMMDILPWLYQRPGVGDVLDALVRGRITPEEAGKFAREAGAPLPLWEWTVKTRWANMGMAEIVALRNREIISDDQALKLLKRLGFNDPEIPGYFEELRHAVPGVADLQRMIVRNLFNPELVGDYGLFMEFPEAARPFFRQLGLDYEVALQLPANAGGGQMTLPHLLYAMTREILPLGSAYQAFQRFRPEAIRDYQQFVPGVRPFTAEDLEYHMRVAGFPPPMRDYLRALAYLPLGRRDVQWGLRYGNKSRDWAYARFLDQGMRPDQASEVADIQYVRAHDHETAWIDSLVTKAHKDTVSVVEDMYDAGVIDRGQALSQLSDAQLPAPLSLQLLDLSDARRSLALLRSAVAAAGRDYLDGSRSMQETINDLAQLGIKSDRAGELMQIWTVQRTQRRRRADTARIIHWVGKGRISADEGLRRLSNLNWVDPDRLLLIAEAQADLSNLQARQEKAKDREDAARARALEKIAREHEAEARKARAEANRVASRSTLTTWLKDGIISQDEFRDSMRERGFPDDKIEDYLRAALMPKKDRPRPTSTGRGVAAPRGPKHPAEARMRTWYKDGIITIDQYAQGVGELGYDATAVGNFVADLLGQPANGQPGGAPPA